MPYSPPAYNAVDFDFTGVYAPPSAATVDFDFGGSTPPPSNPQESGHRRLDPYNQLNLFEPAWQPPMRTRNYAPIPIKRRPVLFSVT